MKISEITIADLKAYANVDHNEDDSLFTNILIACKVYISGYTGLPITPIADEKSLDDYEDLSMAVYILTNELYDNRTFSVEEDTVNPVISSILGMHSVNLL